MDETPDAAGRAELTEQILGAEQDERRRIALFLHDGPVQSLSGIALMLDAVGDFLNRGSTAQAREILDKALSRTRTTIGELRDLSFNLEPVVLRDQGFGMAVNALAQEKGLEHKMKVELELVQRRSSASARRQRSTRSCARRSMEPSAVVRPRRSPFSSSRTSSRGLQSPSVTTPRANGDGGRSRCSRSVRERSAQRFRSITTSTDRRCGSCCPCTPCPSRIARA